MFDFARWGGRGYHGNRTSNAMTSGNIYMGDGAMEIEDQKTTFDGFVRYTIRSVIAIVIVMGLLAMFVA